MERKAKTEQTGWMPRLIWVFAGCRGHFVGFVMLRLNFVWLRKTTKEPHTPEPLSNITFAVQTNVWVCHPNCVISRVSHIDNILGKRIFRRPSELCYNELYYKKVDMQLTYRSSILHLLLSFSYFIFYSFLSIFSLWYNDNMYLKFKHAFKAKTSIIHPLKYFLKSFF